MTMKTPRQQFTWLLALCLGLVTASVSDAKDEKKASPDKDKQTQSQKYQSGAVERASNLLDMDVKNHRGETVGEVDEVVLTKNRDSIEYLAVSLDDNQEHDRLAVSPDKVYFTNEGNTLWLRASESELARECGFDGDQWPASADVKSGQKLSKSDMKARRLTNVIGMDVQDAQGDEAGEIEDLLVNTRTGKIDEATIRSGGFLGINTNLNTVNWQNVTVRPDQDLVTISETKQRLQREAASAPDYWQRYGFEGREERGPQPDYDATRTQRAYGSAQTDDRQRMGDTRERSRSGMRRRDLSRRDDNESDTQTAQRRSGWSADERRAYMADTKKSNSVERASNLLDMPVENRQGQKVGQVEDVILGKERDSVAYLAIKLDESDDQTRLAVPLEKVGLTRDGKVVSLKSSVSSLERQCSFKADKWPESAADPKGQTLSETDAASRRLSDLVGMRIQGTDGNRVGHIEDLLINTDTGEIQKAAVSSGGFLDLNAKLSTVDWQSIKVKADEGMATVDKNQQRLQQEATEADEYWQQFGFEGEDGRTRSYDTYDTEQRWDYRKDNQMRGYQDMNRRNMRRDY